MEITKMLTVSTANISMETAELLDGDISIVVYNKGVYGWFIHIPDDPEEYDIPQDLLKLMNFAKDLDCEWLCLDRDGEVLDYLETFDW